MGQLSIFHWLVLLLIVYVLWIALRPNKVDTTLETKTQVTPPDQPSAPSEVDLHTDERSPSVTPPIWNPNAVANWSLLFTPIFGAILVSKNWNSLGESRRSKSAVAWAVITPIVLLGLVFLGGIRARGIVSVVQGFLYFGYLIVWYYSSARPQAKYVKATYGKTYSRRGWGKPLLIGFIILIVFRTVDRYLLTLAA